MKIVMANLKLFYQRRGLWFWYLALFPFLFLYFLDSFGRESGVSANYLLISLILGILVAELQRDILAKPFSFCMPEHRGFLRWFVFGVGGTTNYILGILFSQHGLEFSRYLLVILAACLAGMVFFLLGVWLVLITTSSPGMGIFFMLVMTIGRDYLKPLEYMISSIPLLTITTGILICGVFWEWLGRDSLARKYSGESLLMSLADSWNLARTWEFSRKKAAKRSSGRGSAALVRLEAFFLALMEKCVPLSRNRYALGNLYAASGGLFGPWWWIAPVMLIAAVQFFGYFVPDRIDILFFVVPAFGAVMVNLTPCETMLLPGGRVERFYGAVAAGFAITLLSTFLIAGAAIASAPLVNILPDITLEGITYSYHALSVRHSYLCLALIPMTLILGTLFPEKVPVIIFIGPMFAVLFILLAPNRRPEPSLSIGLPEIVGLVAASWISFAVIMGYHCLKRDLVGQRK